MSNTNDLVIYFRCKYCAAIQSLEIKTNKAFFQIEDQYLDKNGRSITEKCQECDSDQVFYYDPIGAPAALGGNKGYVSMERYQKQHPEHYKKKEADLHERLAARKQKRVLDKIDRSDEGGKRDERHQGYGKDQGEGKLKFDE